MKKLDHVRRAVSVLLLCVSLTLCGCSEGEQPENSDTSSAIEESVDVTATETKESEGETIEEVPIDYGNAESFEAALDAGENLEGKVVQFVVKEFHPDSQLGYDIWAGEHLNFISTDNPEVQENDTVTAKVSKVSNLLGSWIINYENVENGIVTEDTITSPQTNESGDPDTSSEEDEGTYDNNANYDIVETASIKNSIGSTTIIHKVLAKKDVSVSGTILAYAADGSVIGKSTDDIVLTEGEYNFFQYYFDADISNADLKQSYKAKDDSFTTGERKAVEMVEYNQSEDDLYVTFKQTGDELGSFAKFKLLFYKDDQIVDCDYGYFDVYAENLTGKGTTDVASVWVYGIDYDRVEYIFEP